MHAAERRRFRILPVSSVNAVRHGVYGLYGVSADVYNKLDTAFVLGHMRSGSSLLTKLLSTSPEIIEHGELNFNYRKRLHLTVMKGRVLKGNNQLVAKPSQRVALDKMLFNYQLEVEHLDLVVKHGVKPIFLVRSPEATIKSMVRTFSFYTVATATAYYSDRVEKLEQYASALNGRVPMIAIDYDDIVHRTKTVFALLEDHLDLETSLSEDFSSQVDSGLGRRRGDPSANISSGVILAKTATPDVPVDVPAADLQRMNAIYERCHAVLRESCAMPSAE